MGTCWNGVGRSGHTVGLRGDSRLRFRSETRAVGSLGCRGDKLRLGRRVGDHIIVSKKDPGDAKKIVVGNAGFGTEANNARRSTLVIALNLLAALQD